ncbi:hypothetical protein SPRG_08309 [Saprolegnia parasitica CBS 223.65]|uniref:Uncharacterized protein n=1 Tax=Saprolegnia parasitica (strain CBS 223.65) TaxID=695850 RepID=A0A067C661_SAPPC|nr:hypothetical protein SPRG_08309 [Saprolegnia parasitica CBS 223.65]KDO26234.1 hypothetical protein SPRG_08309 [Saprolegnia parasitica CBS 223.65]|eukprot:XP_012202943.1 hypothetical protein SPRG_08309 [Saprolegnia parasitica CBS 223.65]
MTFISTGMPYKSDAGPLPAVAEDDGAAAALFVGIEAVLLAAADDGPRASSAIPSVCSGPDPDPRALLLAESGPGCFFSACLNIQFLDDFEHGAGIVSAI